MWPRGAAGTAATGSWRPEPRAPQRERPLASGAVGEQHCLQHPSVWSFVTAAPGHRGTWHHGKGQVRAACRTAWAQPGQGCHLGERAPWWTVQSLSTRKLAGRAQRDEGTGLSPRPAPVWGPPLRPGPRGSGMTRARPEQEEKAERSEGTWPTRRARLHLEGAVSTWGARLQRSVNPRTLLNSGQALSGVQALPRCTPAVHPVRRPCAFVRPLCPGCPSTAFYLLALSWRPVGPAGDI